MDVPLLKESVVPALWQAYKKTKDYKDGAIKAIPEHNPIVEKAEAEGLKKIYRAFIAELNSSKDAREELLNRNIGEWLEECIVTGKQLD